MSMVIVRRKFISFHQNDDFVHFKSFQRNSSNNVRYSHGNDFLPLKFDHGQTYYHRQVSIKETNSDVSKCIKHKRWRQSHRRTDWTQFCRRSKYFSWIGNIFWGENQPLVPKMECHHHHSGNRTQIFYLPLCLVSRCFIAAPRSQSVRGWPVRRAELLSDSGTTEEFQLLPSLFMPSPSSSVCYVVPSVLVATVDYSWYGQQDPMARSGTGYQEFGFAK